MENEKNREFDNLNEETVEETVEEIIEETDEIEEIIDEPSEDASEEIVEESEVDSLEDAEEFSDEEEEIADEDAEAEEEIKPKKDNKKVIIGVVSVLAAIVIAIVVYCICIVNGVGGKSIVNAKGFFTKEQHMDVKFENPVMGLCDKVVLGSKDNTVFKVNDKAVSKDVFMYYVNYSTSNYVTTVVNEKLQPQMASLTTEDQVKAAVKKVITEIDWNAPVDEKAGLSVAESLRAKALSEDVVPMIALIAEGEKKGITLTEEENKEINDSIAQMKAQYGSEYEKYLAANGFKSEATYVELMRTVVLAEKIVADFNKDMSKYIDVAELEKYMQADNESVTVKHILIIPDEEAEDKEKAKAEAKATAEDVLKRAQNGEDFDKLIEIYGKDPGQGPEGYTFKNDGTMVKEFTDASFALNEDEISGLVETTYGYHIIKRIKKTPSFQDYYNYLGDTSTVRIKRGIYEKCTVTTEEILKLIGIE